jgi:hypothetical protein
MIETLLRQRSPAAGNPGNQYLAVGMSVAPFIAIYKRNGDTFTRLATPASVPIYAVTGVAWNGYDHLITVHAAYPYATVYKVNRFTDSFTKLPDFVTNQGYADTGAVSITTISGTTYMAFTFSLVPYLKSFIISGDTFGQCSNPALPLSPATGSSAGNDIKYNLNSGSGNWFAVGTQGRLYIYRTANPPVQVTHSMTAGGGLQGRNAVLPSVNDDFMMYGAASTLYLHTITGGPSTPTFGTNTPSTITHGGTCFSLTQDSYWSCFIAAGCGSSPFLKIYDCYGQFISQWTTYTLSANPPSHVVDSCFTYESDPLLACAHAASPYISFYRRSGTSFNKLSDPAVLPNGAATSIALSATF